MYTHTVRKQEGGEVVETRTNISRQIYDQLLSQVINAFQIFVCGGPSGWFERHCILWLGLKPS